ncbi:MAG: zinc ribbon domain-containing protein [Thermoplasmatota archaeon]
MKKVLILIFLLVLTLVVTPNFDCRTYSTGSHWFPERIETGQTTYFHTVIISNGSSRPKNVYLRISDNYSEMYSVENISDETIWREGVLYSCTKQLEEPGSFDLEIIIELENGSRIKEPIGAIEIKEKETESEGDTILGLPKLYCGLSIIFLTFIVILLTWSYFKGKRIQNKNIASTGAIKITCSACGTEIGPDDDTCSKCGADLEEEEHICGKCGNNISPTDMECPKCGSRLKPVKKGKDDKKDQDILKLRGGVDKKGKKTCSNCGAVYMEREGKCPECGSRKIT